MWETEIFLENEIVQLKPLEESDANAILQASVDPAIWTHMSITLLSEEAVRQYIEMMLNKKQSKEVYPFVIIDKRTNQLVGGTAYSDIDAKHNRLEIGYTWLAPAAWRTAINTNCKYLLLAYAFEVQKFTRVQIKTGTKNLRSQKAIERLGAVREGILRNHMVNKDGTMRDTVMYSIIPEDWPVVKAHFETQLL